MVVMAALETWNLCKEVRGRIILNQINLKVHPGSVCVLLGPEGSGKSTLFKIILGIQAPTTGGGLCLGLDILTEGLQIRDKTGFVAQAPCYYDYMTAKQLIGFCRSFYSRWDSGLAEKILKQLDLPMMVKVSEFNEEKRSCLGLALALASDPGLLLVDQLSASFDPDRRRLFYRMAIETVSGGSGAVLIASSRLDEEVITSGQVVLMEQGKLVYSGPMETLRLSERDLALGSLSGLVDPGLDRVEDC